MMQLGFGSQTWGPPPSVPFRQTLDVVNNQRALGSQQALKRTYAGAGLARGRGHMALDRNRGDVARANADSEAAQTVADDQFFNAGLGARYRFGAANEQLQYDSLDEQRRQSQWDSRFGNMTTAWGALAGLLR